MTDFAAFALLVAAAAVLLLIGVRLLMATRRSPAQRARAHRKYLSSRGRLADAVITDFRQDEIFYQYHVSGAVYDSAQNVALFRDRLPADIGLLLGPAYVKYSARNPGQSILISEDWSGIRKAIPPPPSPKEENSSI